MRKKIKIFDFDYLLKGDYTEDDLFYFFETSSLTLSLIVAMFKLCKINATEKEILKIIKDKDWMYTRYINDKQRESLENDITKIYRNVYYISETEARSRTDWWYIQYGFNNIKTKKNKTIGKLYE